MENKDFCREHSRLATEIENLKENNKEQWTAINKLRNRLPTWATAAISLLTFLLGCSVTYAGLLIRLAGQQ